MIYIAIVILVLVILPLNLHSVETFVYDPATIPLDAMVDRWWLRSMYITFEKNNVCSGESAVVESEDCSTLPTTWYTAYYDACNVYALAGSFANVTIKNRTTFSTKNAHIWITHTLYAYKKMLAQFSNGGDQYRCGRNYTDASCYDAENYAGSSIQFNVQTPGYYCILSTNVSDLEIVAPVPLGIEWSFTYVSYDFEAIKDQYAVLAPWKSIDGMVDTTITVSSPFNFTRKNCAVLRVNRCNDIVKVSIGHYVRRWDVAAIVSCLYATMLCVLLLSVLMLQFCCKISNRK